jgi:hypothetical protein
MNWIRQESDHNGIKTGTATKGKGYSDSTDPAVHASLANSDFYKYHTDQQHKISTGHWDGVIPAGVPFKFETWHSNGKTEGFDGEVVLIPNIPAITDSDAEGFTISMRTTGFGSSDVGEEEAAIGALTQANRKKVLAFDKKLVEYGYAYQGRKWKKFLNLADSVSRNQGITAGWNINATGVTGG